MKLDKMYVYREDIYEYLTLDNGFPYWSKDVGDKYNIDIALEIIENPEKWGIQIENKKRLVLRNKINGVD